MILITPTKPKLALKYILKLFQIHSKHYTTLFRQVGIPSMFVYKNRKSGINNILILNHKHLM